MGTLSRTNNFQQIINLINTISTKHNTKQDCYSLYNYPKIKQTTFTKTTEPYQVESWMRNEPKNSSSSAMRNIHLVSNLQRNKCSVYNQKLIREKGESEERSGEEEKESSLIYLLLSAFNRITNLKVVKLTNMCGRKPIFILIDFGSTHNFQNEHKLLGGTKMKVAIVINCSVSIGLMNCNKISESTKCIKFFLLENLPKHIQKNH